MNKKKVLLFLILIVSVLGNIVLLSTVKSNNPNHEKSHNQIAMYLENESGGYDLSTQKGFPTEGYILNTEKSKCKNGGTLTQDLDTKKLTVSVSSTDECSVYFDKVLSSLDTLKHLNQTSNGVRTDFDDPATTDEGIYEMEDDYGTSYYYRGAVEDNYVKYGINAQGQEMWWRIIRINGDGSVRMVYDGTQGYTNGTVNNDRFIKLGKFNANSGDAKYVGWMYGPEGTTASTSKEEAQTNTADSDAKKIVDAWYKENIEDTGYGTNISDEIFCNDRSTPGEIVTGYGSDTGLGYGRKTTAYGATARTQVWNGKASAPIFTCPEKNDAFTVSDTKKGNGALTYPVGLITADEIVFAGSGKFSTANKQYYLYRGTGYLWSLSPYCMNSGSSITSMFVMNSSLINTSVYSTLGNVAPVINLNPEYARTMLGTGTITDLIVQRRINNELKNKENNHICNRNGYNTDSYRSSLVCIFHSHGSK